MLSIRNSLTWMLFLSRGKVGLCRPREGKKQTKTVQVVRREERLGVSRDGYLRIEYLLFLKSTRNLNQFMNFKHYWLKSTDISVFIDKEGIFTLNVVVHSYIFSLWDSWHCARVQHHRVLLRGPKNPVTRWKKLKDDIYTFITFLLVCFNDFPLWCFLHDIVRLK